MDVPHPIVSVITVVLNGDETISELLNSVRNQQQVTLEHIVIDGESEDGTREALSSFPSGQHVLRWISEPDSGIYDAMNKGVALAQGDWLIFLGADDVLASPTVLAEIFLYQDLSGYDVICGRSCYRNGRECSPMIGWRTNIFNTVHHQAAFYRKSLFDGYRYRTDIPVIADYELNFRILHQKIPLLLVQTPVAVSGTNGISHRVSRASTLLDAFRIRSRYINVLRNTLYLSIGLADYLAVVLGRLFRRL